ncbi:MAG: hypothetical protein HC890_15805 [Chloroflexaceae bacterium]|nr:hypothetical protein [Chloroflexaceae bacterium]
MNIQRWLARREAYWQRLEILLKQVEKKGIKFLKAKEIRELASLYRSVSADLARARTGKLSHPTIAELQNLTARPTARFTRDRAARSGN